MLVITRRPGETIHVGEDVVITITGVHGKKVRVGVTAPRDKVIWKGELDHEVGSPVKPESEEEGADAPREEAAVAV